MVSFFENKDLIFDILELIVADPVPLKTLDGHYFLSFSVFSLVDLGIMTLSDSF